MKRVCFTLIGLFACMEIIAQLGYHYEGNFIQLIPDTAELYYIQARNQESIKYLKERADVAQCHDNSKSEVYMISEDVFFVSTKSGLLETDYISVLFRDTKGNPYYVLPRIVLVLKDNAHIADVVKGFDGILSTDSVQELRGMITLTCNLNSAQEVLKVVAELDGRKEVEWCEPDMICRFESHGTNPLFYQQYYLQNGYSGQYDINVVPAWEIATGSSTVTVAVIDSGVDPDHEDLSGSVLQGYTIGDATGYGKPKNANEFNRKSHGVACAGIIGARDNNYGILGVAYGVKILPVNVAPYFAEGHYEDGEKIVDSNGWTASNYNLSIAIQWAAERADILSCSWGSNSWSNVIASSINNAINNGRNGKGCIVVASSGNDYPDETTIKFPARIDGVVAVGAINRYGSIQGYSQRGDKLDLVAPSGDGYSASDITTTDRMGNLGYNPYDTYSDLDNKNYTQRFSGTSAACPQVSGVAALMLSVNPYLTVSQVHSILCNTARKLPGMNGQNRTDTFGYGLVNAYAAVVNAMDLKIEGPQLVCTYGSYSIDNLPSGVTVSWSLSDNYYNTHNCLMSNYPSIGHCLITRDNSHDMMDATLTAKIKKDGVTVRTLTKNGIYAYASFKGSYTSGNLSGNINSSGTFNIKTNTVTTVTSPNFYGATVTYSSSGATPSSWGFNSSSGILNFNTLNTTVPVIINVHDGCGNNYTLYAFPSGSYSINVSNGEGEITVSLVEDGDASKDFTLDEPWTMEITSATTGRVMATRSSASRSETISTAGWPKGIYIVKVTIGKEELTEKVLVN